MKTNKIIIELLNNKRKLYTEKIMFYKYNILYKLLELLVRKLTTQKFRLSGLSIINKNYINYFSRDFSLDYLKYCIINHPKDVYNYFPLKDKKEIDYFIRIILKGALAGRYHLSDFEGRWDKYEIVRKEVGRNLKFNILNSQYSLYGFKSIVYPDTGIFPDNYKLNLFKDRKHQVCFDIGAYIGDSAYIINKELKPDRIYAFEPETANYRILEHNIKLNFLKDVVEPVNMATSDKSGTMIIDSLNASSNIKSKGRGHKVRVVTIDRFVEQRNIKKVDLIKMDIEGAEMDTLLGAKNVIKKHKPDLVIAIYHRGQHFFEIPPMLKKLVPNYKFRFIALSGSSPVIERFVMASVKNI